MTNTTDREEQLVELVYSVLGYEHADNITKCRHVANKILAWHEQKMAGAEKEENDQYKVNGGYLKTQGYKEAWRNAWNNATDEDRRKTLELPNWDNEIFKEITVNGVKYRRV